MNLRNLFMSAATVAVVACMTQLQAVTRVYLSNETDKQFNLSYTQRGEALDLDKWSRGPEVMLGGNRAEVLSFDRAVGIENDSVYEFEVAVKMGDNPETVLLRQKVTGTMLASSLEFAASGPGFEELWQSDRDEHVREFTLGDASYRLTYKSVATGGNDDLEYSIAPVVSNQ